MRVFPPSGSIFIVGRPGNQVACRLDDPAGGSATHLRPSPSPVTAGFSVENNAGTGGISTAGHCTGVSAYKWMATGETTPTTWMNQHLGQYGDVEWETTPNPEVPEFYSGTGVRDVDTIRQVGEFARNDTYCKFGQTSGYGCSTVWRVSGDCNYDGTLVQ